MMSSFLRRTPMTAVDSPVALPPLAIPTLLQPAVRVVLTALAVASILLWVVETPPLYHAALQLHNTTGMFSMRPAQWALGLHRLHLSPTVYAVVSIGGLYVMTGTMYIVGLVIFLRRSREVIAVLVSYMFITLGAGIINAYAGGPALVHAHPQLAVPVAIYTVASNFSYYLLFLIPLLFPDGRFAPPWVGWLVAAAIVSQVLPLHNLPWLTGILQIPAFAAIFLAPIYRYRRLSDASQREQTKWVVFGLLVALAVYLSMWLIQIVIPGFAAHPERRVLLALVGGTIASLALSFLPVSFGVAILRYRLWEIDILINRTLVYGSLTVTLAGLYIGGVIVLQALFRTITGQSSGLAVAIATLAVAAIFNPWRRRLQAFIDRRFYRRKYDAARTLAALTSRLRDEVDLDRLSEDLLLTVEETLQPQAVALWLTEGTQ
ncbi:MAG TPA: hypothetical protein VFB58_00785 [Chloroflexota bacterium]|nr:hypothetical protein [Chloroflexota bacterium]